MTRRIIGPPLDAMKESAKAAAAEHFTVQLATRPACLRATDDFKAGQARAVLAGGASDFLAREAKLRGVDVADLARIIVEQSALAQRAELARIALNLAIEAAPDHATVSRLLADCKIELPAFAG